MYHPAVKTLKQILMEHTKSALAENNLYKTSDHLQKKKGKSLKDMLARAKIKFEGDNATPHGESVPVCLLPSCPSDRHGVSKLQNRSTSRLKVL